uniref:Immunoglobulin V-set domain-containing protein n=1 Tax=Neogobius melanostomus TaxID=47308 RepID=A0A8C6SQC7_9GOBI
WQSGGAYGQCLGVCVRRRLEHTVCRDCLRAAGVWSFSEHQYGQAQRNIVTRQAQGTFTLRKNNDIFKMEKVSENEAVTFTFLKVNFSQGGHYYCEYRRNASRGAVTYPQGESIQLTITGNKVYSWLFFNYYYFIFLNLAQSTSIRL